MSSGLYPRVFDPDSALWSTTKLTTSNLSPSSVNMAKLLRFEIRLVAQNGMGFRSLIKGFDCHANRRWFLGEVDSGNTWVCRASRFLSFSFPFGQVHSAPHGQKFRSWRSLFICVCILYLFYMHFYLQLQCRRRLYWVNSSQIAGMWFAWILWSRWAMCMQWGF